MGNEIKFDKRNYRKHSDKNKSLINKSLKECGAGRSIVIDNDGEIIAGNGIYEQAQKLKIPTKIIETDGSELVVVKRTDLKTDDEKRKQLAIMDNSTSDSSEFDFESLQTDFDVEQLQDWGLDVEFESLEEQEIIEDEVLEEVEIKCKLSDIWQLGNHRLMCGDSTSITDVEKLMDGAKADMVFTDPPYNVAFNGRSGKFDVILNDNLSNKDFENFINGFLNVINFLNPASYYICCNWAFYGIMQLKLKPKACIVWAKNVFGLGKGYRHQHEFILFDGFIDASITNESDLWEIKKDKNYKHPTQKPVELSARAIKNSSKQKQNIFDLFGGSGSTLIACEQLDRKCYMMELDPHYCDVIIQRWENLTGKKAELLNG